MSANISFLSNNLLWAAYFLPLSVYILPYDQRIFSID